MPIKISLVGMIKKQLAFWQVLLGNKTMTKKQSHSAMRNSTKYEMFHLYQWYLIDFFWPLKWMMLSSVPMFQDSFNHVYLWRCSSSSSSSPATHLKCLKDKQGKFNYSVQYQRDSNSWKICTNTEICVAPLIWPYHLILIGYLNERNYATLVL